MWVNGTRPICGSANRTIGCLAGWRWRLIFCKKVRDDKFLLGWNPRDGGRLVLSHLGISSLGRFDLFNDNDDQSCFLTAGLATWIFNGGYTSLYFEVTPKKLCEEKNISIIFQFGKHGILWSLLEFPLVFIPTDYITYWLHRSCLCQVFFCWFCQPPSYPLASD